MCISAPTAPRYGLSKRFCRDVKGLFKMQPKIRAGTGLSGRLLGSMPGVRRSKRYALEAGSGSGSTVSGTALSCLGPVRSAPTYSLPKPWDATSSTSTPKQASPPAQEPRFSPWRTDWRDRSFQMGVVAEHVSHKRSLTVKE